MSKLFNFGLKESDVTPEDTWLNRRQFLGLGAAAAACAYWGPAKAYDFGTSKPAAEFSEKLTPESDVTSYNNYQEFGSGKGDPARFAGRLKTDPWSVQIDGLCDKPGTIGLEDLIKPHALEERIYRLRCVEAWSMVIPWLGVPLGPVLARFAPQSGAKYVEFQTLADEMQMPFLKSSGMGFPYVEGLRMDEAMHPLAFLAVGLYGRNLLPQNGAPLRLVVPWKYGFKSIKSIVRIRFTDTQPTSTWMRLAADEYGFYANVNPAVDHPRWSQAEERRIGEFRRRKTLPFNGYADGVAGLYQGMDLAKFY